MQLIKPFFAFLLLSTTAFSQVTVPTQQDFDSLRLRVEALERIVVPVPEPEPEPEPEPPPPQPSKRLSVSDFKLVGGFRLKEPFSGGGLAIDFDKKIIYQGGHDQRDMVVRHALPDIGLGEPGDNHASWPIATRIDEMAPFWKDQPWGEFANLPDQRLGLCVRDGKLWVSPRVFYDTKPANMTIVSDAGDRVDIPLLRPGFGGGFIDGHPEFLVGCGAYRSGQGSKAGPTVAKFDGTVLLDQVGFGDMRFSERTPRPSGSWPVGGKDVWYGFIPRKPDGTLCTKEEALAGVGVGAWNSDTIQDGGVWTERGLCFWAMLGFGELDYAWQSEQFARSGMSRPYLYTYDPVTFARDSVQYEEWPWGQIIGCEVGPDGRIYLMRRNAWKGSMYVVDSAIYVFELAQ